MKIANSNHWEVEVTSGKFSFIDNLPTIFQADSKIEYRDQMSLDEYILRFVHPENASNFRKEISSALETTDPTYNGYLEHKVLYEDGHVGYIAVNIFIAKDDSGKINKIYGANQDITELKRAEEAVQRIQHELETRVAERTQELNKRIAQVEMLNKATNNLFQDLRAMHHRQQETNQELARLHEKLREQRITEQEALLRLSQTLLGEVDIQPILDMAVNETGRALQVENVSLILLDNDGDHISMRANLGWSSNQSQRITHLPIMESGAIGEAIRRCQPIVNYGAVDEFTSSLSSSKPFEEAGIKAKIVVPLLVGDRVIGSLAANSYTPRNWTDDEIRLLSLFGDRIALALERARLFEQVNEGRIQFEDLSQRLLQVQETERHTIARELHDEIGQIITAVKTNLEVLGLAELPDTARPTLYITSQIVDHALDQIRKLSLDLRPSLLDDFGLQATIEWYLERQMNVPGLSARLVSDLGETRFPTNIETTAFRMVQAALTNTLRHAHATNVVVQFQILPPSSTEGNPELEVCVRDDGMGFDVEEKLEQARHGKSMGLLAIQERVQLVGGKIIIESAPGKGTHIYARLPIKEEA